MAVTTSLPPRYGIICRLVQLVYVAVLLLELFLILRNYKITSNDILLCLLDLLQNILRQVVCGRSDINTACCQVICLNAALKCSKNSLLCCIVASVINSL